MTERAVLRRERSCGMLTEAAAGIHGRKNVLMFIEFPIRTRPDQRPMAPDLFAGE